jgi:CheY-like chemotaxis protein
MLEKPHARDGIDALAGVRVLVVEDAALLAMLAEAHLISFGCEIANVAATAVEALEIIRDAEIHVALLDISLREGTSFGVADALAEKDVPYVFVTGHGRDKLPDEHSGAPLIQKPYEPDELRSAILQSLGLGVA